jgi:hypothetical protein
LLGSWNTPGVETKIEGKRGFHLMGLQGRGSPATTQSSESEPGWGFAATTSLQSTSSQLNAQQHPLQHCSTTAALSILICSCTNAALMALPLPDIDGSHLQRTHWAEHHAASLPIQSKRLLEGQGRSDMEAVTLEAHTPRSQTSIPVTKKRQYDQKRDEKRIPKEI